MPLSAATILNELRADPGKFLRHYHLVIAGGGLNTNSGSATFVFSDKDRTTKGFTTGLSGMLGTTKDRAMIRFCFSSSPESPSPDIAKGEFNAYYVAMKQTTDGPATTHFPLPSTGPDLMLTSQLSGCSFGIGSNAAGARLVSHIQPAKGGAADDLRQAVLRDMTGSAPTVFDRESQALYGSGQNRATILGLRDGSSWRFYAQTYVSGGQDALLEAKEL